MTNKTWARVDNGVVAEMIVLPADVKPAAAFHKTISDAMVEVSDRPDIAEGFTYANGKFTPPPPPPIALIKSIRVSGLRAACQAAIVGGFASDALGTPHSYPSTPTDQQNLMNAAVAAMVAPDGIATPLWCAANPANAASWTLAPHNAAQTKQVAADCRAFIAGAQQKLVDLTAAVAAAGDAAQVNAIEW